MELTRDSFSADRMEMYWSAGVTHLAMLLPRYCAPQRNSSSILCITVLVLINRPIHLMSRVRVADGPCWFVHAHMT